MIADTFGPRSWRRPECVGHGRLPARTTFVPFPDEASAATGDRDASPFFARLDGAWRFRLVDQPEAAPDDFADPNLDDLDWDAIEVPGNWTLQGHDRPHYTNVQMPFSERPPDVPDANPTGLYRRRFTLPEAFHGRRIVLHLGGAESAVYVWMNGNPVGMSKDSRLPSEYDVTPWAQPGENLLAVMVVRWSDGSFLEDQDHWWMAGLHREVLLVATGDTHIADVQTRAQLGEDLEDGLLCTRVVVGAGADLGPGWRVRVGLSPISGGPARGKAREAPVPTEAANYFAFHGHEVTIETPVRRPVPWSAETPALHRVVVSLLDPEGRCTEATSVRVGFRRVEVRDRKLLVNGEPVRIRGVNRHDHDDRLGKAVTRAGMREDAVQMKRFNVNAVRTSHYPNDPYWLDLCDELGLYVVDEANIETHAYMSSLCDDPRYAMAFLDRGMRMVQRDLNHPSVILWSLGNESGGGANHEALAGWMRSFDPTRPLHYEGAIMRDWSGGRSLTDVVCPMYASPDAIRKWSRRKPRGDPRPLILCEYAHAMGNSGGGLDAYFDAFESCDGLQGGFVWDWVDQGLEQCDDAGHRYWAYGGDFGDTPHDRNFCINGMAFPDRSPHPMLWEFKKLAQPLAVRASDLRRGRLIVESRQHFSNLRWLRGRWEVCVDGRRVQHGRLPRLDVEPGEALRIQLPLRRPRLGPGEECHLTLFFDAARDLPWAPKGHPVAWEQFALPWQARPRRAEPPQGEVHLAQDDSGTTLRAGHVEAHFDRTDGSLASLRRDDREILVRAPRLQLWRAPTDNDGVAWGPLRMPQAGWRGWGLDDLALETDGITARRGRDGSIGVVVRQRALGQQGLEIPFLQRWTLDPSGALHARHQVTIPRTVEDLPRVGVTMALARGLERLEWLGRGPHESYSDRKAGAGVGRFGGLVDEQYVPYILPQENGNKTDVRWLSLAGAHAGLLVVGDPLLEFSAHHFDATDLDRARHTNELAFRDEIVLNLDARQAGVGTAAVGPPTPKQHCVGPGRHRIAFTLVPYASEAERADLIARVRASRA